MEKDAINLQSKHAVVTGAASGIGRAIAEAFARAGATVTLLDLKRESVEAVAAEITRDAGTKCRALACDVSDEAKVAAVFSSLGDASLDILVNSAGIAHVGSLLDTTPEDLNRLFRVNVLGTYLCMREAVRRMVPHAAGVVLNMASIAATSGISDRFAYSMTKGAVLAMTLSTAKDFLSHGIRCNCISPARVHTPFVDGFLASNYPGREAEMLNKLAASQPIGRMGTPEEIAKLALYLCSDAANFITGSDIPIDGGFTKLR